MRPDPVIERQHAGLLPSQPQDDFSAISACGSASAAALPPNVYSPPWLQVGREERHAGSHGCICFLYNLRGANPGRCGSSPGLVVVGGLVVDVVWLSSLPMS